MTAPAARPHPVDVVLLLGTCRPERRGVARAIGASGIARIDVDEASTPREVVETVDELLERVTEASSSIVVVDCPAVTQVEDVLPLFAAPRSAVRLVGVSVVVDALDLHEELARTDFLDVDSGARRYQMPWAHVAVLGIEHATQLIVTNWRAIGRDELSRLLALLSHLNPAARLTLLREGRAPDLETRPPAAILETSAPGWVAILNGAFRPPIADPELSALRYERMRPFHPGRLAAAVERDFDQPGVLARSAGLFRLATRPGMTGRWSQVGSIIGFDPLAADDPARPLSFGQDIAFLGWLLDAPALEATLDACLLSDDEFAAGPGAWSRLPDPLPAWDDALRS